jgi:hypothetical protein
LGLVGLGWAWLGLVRLEQNSLRHISLSDS